MAKEIDKKAGPQITTCGICNDVFPWENDAINHLKHSHIEAKAFDCGVCFEFYHKHFMLEEHLLENHLIMDTGPSLEFSKPTVDQETIDQFMAASGRREEVRLDCPFCKEQFRKLSLYQLHMSVQHKGKAWDKEGLCLAILKVTPVGEEGTGKSSAPKILSTSEGVVRGRVFTCGECGVKVYGRESMNRHAATHTLTPCYTCRECWTIFLSRQSFLRHDAAIHRSLTHLNIKKNRHGDIIGTSLEEILTAQDCFSALETPIPVKAVEEEKAPVPPPSPRKTHKRGCSNDSLPDPSDPFHDLLLLTKCAVRQCKLLASTS